MTSTVVHNGRNFGNFCLNYVERIMETGDAIGASVDRNSRNVPLEFSSVAGKVVIALQAAAQLPTITDDTNHTKARCTSVPL